MNLNLSFYLRFDWGLRGWVLLATRTGMPVSTTHAIAGRCGAGYVAFGIHTFHWQGLWAKFLIPLAVSPILSLVIVYLIAWPVVFLLGRVAERCICVVDRQRCPWRGLLQDGQLFGRITPRPSTDSVSNCAAAEPVAALSTLSAANGTTQRG